ncbi:MAG: ABC transporter permease [Anaerolineae bacterium]|nr:ABC transporter permease [Anaerolineae bacterium]
MKRLLQIRITRHFSVRALVFAVVLLLVWEAASATGFISRLFFPPPSAIVQTLITMTLDGRLPTHTAATVIRISLGVMMGIVPGTIFGILMGWSRRLREIFDPIIAATHPIPKIAIFPLVLIIFGIGELSKVVVVAISAFFPALINTMTGVFQLDPVYFEVAHNYGAGRWKTFTRVLLPGSLPHILSGTRLGLNTGLMVAIAVELISAKTGLGVLVWFSWQTLRVEELYATLVVVSVMGMAINVGLRWLFARLAPWSNENSPKTV